MSTISGVLNTALMGLQAQQGGLSVTGNNISNVNTPGYTLEQADLQAGNQSGVTMVGVQRLQDEYLQAQLCQANANEGASSTLSTNLTEVQTAMGQSTDATGLTQSLESFFTSFQNLALQPSDTATRQAVLGAGEQLATSFNSQADQLQQINQQLDQQVVGSVSSINSITGQIASLNSQIQQAGSQTTAGQDSGTDQLFDQRDQLLSQLSAIVPVQVIPQGQNGSITVLGAGVTLVDGTTQHQLIAAPDPSNPGRHQVLVQEAAGDDQPINQNLNQGSLGGLLQSRDYTEQALSQVDQMAAQLVQTVNAQQSAGTGLDGVSGRNFFSGLSVTATASGQNTGSATVSSTALTGTAPLDLNDYAINFTSPSQYNIVNTTTGTTVSSNNSYSSGAGIDFAGMSVVLTGTPAAGDEFNVNGYSGTAQQMSLSTDVQNNPQAVAAGQSSATGDNSNANALAALGSALTMGNPPTQSFESYLDSARLNIGTALQNAQTAETDNQTAQQQIQGLNNSVSGVSLDQESIKLIQYQQGYQASSQVVNTVNAVMTSLMQMFVAGQ